MKSFKKFLNESYLGKDGKIYPSKGEYENTIKLLNKTLKTDGIQTKLDLGNTSTTNLPGGGEKVNRGPGRPVGSTTKVKSNIYQQPELDLNKTDNTTKVNTNTTKTNTTKVDLKTRMADAFNRNKNIIKNNRRNKIINKINTDKNLTRTYVAPSDKVSRDIQLKSIENQINRSTEGSKKITPKKTFVNKNRLVNLNKVDKPDALSKFLFGDDPNKPVKTFDRKIPIKDRNVFNPNTGRIDKTTTRTTRLNQPIIGSRGERLSDPGKTFSQIRNDSQTRIGSGSIKNQIKTDNVVNPNKIKKVIADVDPSTTQRNRVINKKFGDQSLASKIKTKPKVGKLLGKLGAAAAVVDSARVFRNVYKDSQARGDTKRKSALRGASTVAGGIVGGALGTLAAAPIPIPGARLVGGAYGYSKGQELGQKAFDTLSTKTGREMARRKIGKTFKQFRKDAFSVDKENLKKVNQAVGK